MWSDERKCVEKAIMDLVELGQRARHLENVAMQIGDDVGTVRHRAAACAYEKAILVIERRLETANREI